MMQKLRDDARERGLRELAPFYAREAFRRAAEELRDAVEKLGKRQE